MTDEEVKAYVEKIEKTPVSELYNILPSYDVYNADIIMGKICDALSENVNILRKLNIESKDHELDAEIAVNGIDVPQQVRKIIINPQIFAVRIDVLPQ